MWRPIRLPTSFYQPGFWQKKFMGWRDAKYHSLSLEAWRITEQLVSCLTGWFSAFSVATNQGYSLDVGSSTHLRRCYLHLYIKSPQISLTWSTNSCFEWNKVSYNRTALIISGRITVQLVSSLTRLYLTKKNILVFSETIESMLVRPTNRTVKFTPYWVFSGHINENPSLLVSENYIIPG